MHIIPLSARDAWPLVAAVVAGFALLPSVQQAYAEWSARQEVQRQQASPVVRMSGTLVGRDAQSVHIHIRGEKLRECRYAGVSAYAIDTGGVRHDANIRRTDAVHDNGRTKPPGLYDLGVWRVWPITPQAVRVMVVVEHLCGSGVAVRSLIAEVPL